VCKTDLRKIFYTGEFETCGGDHEGQEVWGHHADQELGDDVDDTTEKGDVAPNEGVKGDDRVHVTFRGVGTNGYGDTKVECVGNVRNWVDEHGDELNQTHLLSVRVSGRWV